MLNQIVLVGRLTQKVELRKDESERNCAKITIAIPRSYKNIDGIYETDFVDCIIWDGIAEKTAEYCFKGDLVGIKGRLQTRTCETEDGQKKKIMEVIAEKVTFLTSKKSEERNEEDGE